MSYSLDGVLGGLGVAGLGVGLEDSWSLGGVVEDSTVVKESSSLILSSLAGEDVLLMTGAATGRPVIVPSFLNSDASIPYII